METRKSKITGTHQRGHKRQVYSITSIPQESKKVPNTQPNLTSKGTGKKKINKGTGKRIANKA